MGATSKSSEIKELEIQVETKNKKKKKFASLSLPFISYSISLILTNAIAIIFNIFWTCAPRWSFPDQPLCSRPPPPWFNLHPNQSLCSALVHHSEYFLPTARITQLSCLLKPFNGLPTHWSNKVLMVAWSDPRYPVLNYTS